MTPNQLAFLSMIAHAEGTDRELDPYRVCYGFRHTIQNLTDHPAITGEWFGESLANLGPEYVHEISTAAGRYQITKPTWIAIGKNRLHLPDFGAASQDACALELIALRGAASAVLAGELPEAIRACAPEWASLPGSEAGQPQKTLVALLSIYRGAGGQVA